MCNLHRPSRTFTGLLFILLQQSQEGCVCYGPSAIQDYYGVKHVRVVCHNVSGRGVGNLCHCEEALNGNSWHQRSQLTTRTITYWTKKPMEKQHRIYVIGFWVTDPIHVMIVLLQLIWVKKTEIFLFNYYTVMTTTVILIVYYKNNKKIMPIIIFCNSSKKN